MNTEKTFEIVSGSSDETIELGKKLGKNLKGGEFIELRSDVGGGKTTFTKGISEGAGSDDVVSSPSFMISKTYAGPHFSIHHFDLYRLHDGGIVNEMLQETVLNPEDVAIVEWADVADNVLPKNRIVIELHKIDDEKRKFVCRYPADYEYVFEGVK